MKCPDCNGTGKIQLLVSTAECKACGGNGALPDAMSIKSEGIALKIDGAVTIPLGTNACCDSQSPTVSLGVSGAEELLAAQSEVRKCLSSFGIPAEFLKSSNIETNVNRIEAARLAKELDAAMRQPIDVTGKPTPPEIIKGVYGQTHFDLNCAMRGFRVRLNGEVVKHAVELDVMAGWVRRFEMDSSGGFISAGSGFRQSICFGKVDIEYPWGGRQIPADCISSSRVLEMIDEREWDKINRRFDQSITCTKISADKSTTNDDEFTVTFTFHSKQIA